MTLPPTLTLAVLLQRNTGLFLFALLLLSFWHKILSVNAAKFFIPFGRVKRQPQTWWSAKVEEPVSERRKAFAASQ